MATTMQDDQRGSVLEPKHATLPVVLENEANALNKKGDATLQGSHPLQDVPEHDEEEYSIFSAGMRTYLTYLLGIILMLSTLTATIYFPLIPLLSETFSVSIQDINLTVTVYAILQAVTPGIFASLADISGRRPVLLVLIGVYACASLGLTLNKNNYAALMALRALQSVGGSAMPAIAYGIVADVAIVAERGRMLGPMLSTCNGLSAVGPVAAGAAAYSTGGYIWTFVTLLVISGVCFFLTGFTVPETSRVVVGNGTIPAYGIWRPWLSYLKLRKGHNHSHSTSQEAKRETGSKRPSWKPLDALASLRIIIYPDAAAVLWMVATSYCIYYTFQVAIPTIFNDIYGYNELFIGLAFLPGLAGMTLGGIIAGKLVDRNYAKTARMENIDPEKKKTTMTGSNLAKFPIEAARYRHISPFIIIQIAMVAGYGWAIHYHVHPAVPLIMQFFICALSTLLSHTASALLVDIFPDQSSSAYASGQIMRCGLSAASAAVLDPLIGAVGRGWYFTMLSLFVGISGLGAVYVSLWKGMKWRQARYEKSQTE